MLEKGEYSKEAHSPQDVALFVSAFFDELYRAGVRDVVVSPGSRSTPLAMIAYKSSLNFYLDVDERGAAFFALGIAKATARPACVVCTSGTALANYYPAVMEAESSRVPLIVLSGDRPQHLQHVGAPQTCDQLKAFSNHVKKFWQMPEPLATPKRISYVRQVARDAYAASGAGTLHGGAVHLNFPFDEPLKPDLRAEGLFSLGRADSLNLPLVVETSCVLDADSAQFLVEYLKTHRVIAVCGEGTLGAEASSETVSRNSSSEPCFNDRDQERLALQAFAEEFDIPLLVDPLSQLRSDAYDAIIENYDNLIVREDCPEFDAVIRFGRWPVSKRLTTAIQNFAPTQIVVDPFETRDFTSSTSAFITMEPSDFVASLLAEASIAKQATHEDTASGQVATPYIQEWNILNKQETQRILGAKTNPDSSFEGSYVSALIGALPAHSLLFSANSMAIRAIDTFYVKQPKHFAVLANRGLNGIDGTLSTAFGAAQAFNQTVCLTGDLTLLHDLNSLALQHEMDIRAAEGYTRPSIVVVVMNNSGGAIFDMLPQKQDNPYFERIFLTPQNLDFESSAKTFSIPYKRASSVEQFEKALDCFMGCAGIHLIEIKLPLQGVRERYGAFQ